MKDLWHRNGWNVSEEKIVEITQCTPLLAKLFKQTQNGEQIFVVLAALMRLPISEIRFDKKLHCSLSNGIGESKLLWTYQGKQLTMNKLQRLTEYPLVRAS